MTTSCKAWWRNCATVVDSEIAAIDKMEDDIAPLSPNVSRIRELISSLELCHHKAERWVSNIIEAIATGETTKGLGTRPPGQLHPAEGIWQNACAALSAWCAGCPSTVDRDIVELMGRPTPEKRWLAASLDKTMRLQLNPPAEMRAASALAGPAWIKR